MASSYPAAFDSFPTITADKLLSDAVGGRAHRAMHNDMGDVIEAMQAELGLNPSGQAATVVARLDNQTVVNVKDYGAAGNDTTDDTTAIQNALSAGAGKTVYVPPGTYKITDYLTVSAGTLVTGPGTIHQTGTGKAGLKVNGAGVIIDGLTLKGRQASAAYYAGENAVEAIAPNLAGAYTGIEIRNCTISLWGYAGIQMQFVNGFEISGNQIATTGYNGIAVLSGANGLIQGNRVQGVGPGSSGNMYGISLSYGSTESASNPSTRDVVVDGNIVQDVDWEGIETHGGLRITFSNNQILHCKTGIAFAQGDITAITGGVVTGNLVDHQTDDVVTGTNYAFQVYGISGYPASGVVIADNVFRRHCAGQLSYVTGAVITGNTFDRSRQMCIWIDVEARKSIISNNQFIDNWDSSGGWTYAIRSGSGATNSSAVITGNVIARGAMTAGTKVINDRGCYFDATPSGISFKLLGNDFSAIASAGSEAEGTVDYIATYGGLRVTGKVGFYDTVPIAKPTVTGSRGSNAALASLCTALANLGLITNSTS